MSVDRLSKAYKNSKNIMYDNSSRYVIISDCHRGIGNWGDNFLINQNLLNAALNFYYNRGFCYIELGDGDELWENRDIKQIIQTHSGIFWLMSKFYEEDRFYMVYGNHDIVKKSKKFMKCNCNNYFCECTNSYNELFPNMQAYEGIILENRRSGHKIFLTHGHQGDLINDQFWRLGRFLVRYVWRPLELLGVNNPTSAAQNYHKKNSVERRLVKWSEKQDTMLIVGHTHRPSFPNNHENKYYNTGSCVHPRCITAIEIVNNEISLVKWSVKVRENMNMYIGRDILEGPEKIN